VAADEVVARHLALAPGTLVVRLRRVRLADGVAMSFDETYLPREWVQHGAVEFSR